MTAISFHFLLLAIGKVLEVDNFVTPQMLQDFIANEDEFGGIRVPLDDCRMALYLMENCGFIRCKDKDLYIWKNHTEKRSKEK